METIKIKRLAFNSYLELSGIIGFLTGLVTAFMNFIRTILSITGNPDGYIIPLLIILFATPIVSYLGGLIIGVVSYYPYKLIMEIKKGTTLKVIK